MDSGCAIIPSLVHLYLHVPFCQRRCSYCDFSIAVRKRIPAQEYVEAILNELTRVESPAAAPRGKQNLTAASLAPREESPPVASSFAPGRGPGARHPGEVDTLYLGGGTPSLLPPEAITTLVDKLLRSADPGPAARGGEEVTLEANPEDVTPDHAKAWRASGINRVSLGAGIENISLDLIFALPDELKRDWERDLDLALALRPQHMSLYGLTVEPRTPLDRWISRGATQAPDDERFAEEYLLAHRRLMADGFLFYEVSNASLPDFHSRHNSAYWSGKPYRGLGPAAHSFDGTTRRWNLRAWEAYRRAITEGRSAVESEERLTAEQREMEAIYLGLRTAEGLPLAAASPRRPSPPPHFAAQGWLVEHNGRLRCTPEGWLRLDSLVNELAMHTETRQ